MMYRIHLRRRRGGSIVELLVVIGVLAILTGLLLPAVQAAREAARRTQCSNHLKQIGIAFQLHETSFRHFPTGGWGWGWHGEPDRGFDRAQPGGWVYNVLPFLEQQALRSRGAGATAVFKRAEGKLVAETALSLFNCPSRRRAQAYPFVTTTDFFNIDRPSAVGRSDYAACMGDLFVALFGPGPATLAEGDDPAYAWTQTDNTGICYRRSEIRLADVTDGASHTYMVGEKYLDRNDYLNGVASNDNESMYAGYDRDTLRTTHPFYPPLVDQPGVDNSEAFGSAHVAAFHVVFCDGSVHAINYQVDAEINRRLGNRSDGGAIAEGLVGF